MKSIGANLRIYAFYLTMVHMSGRLRGWIGLFVMGAGVLFLHNATVHAELESNNYRFEESTLGAGGLMQSSSANYSATDAVGDVAIGTAASSNYQVQAGSKTSPDPTLSVAIDTTGANFGNFTATASSVATATFSVSNYTSYGYVVQVTGSPPRNGSHEITALATETSPQVGVKQFGMNLVANTSPSSVGSNPDQGEFGKGVAGPNYSTPNQYRFVNGETIASAPSTSGVTKFTITYMANVDALTYGGQYQTDQVLIVTGTY